MDTGRDNQGILRCRSQTSSVKHLAKGPAFAYPQHSKVWKALATKAASCALEAAQIWPPGLRVSTSLRVLLLVPESTHETQGNARSVGVSLSCW